MCKTNSFSFIFFSLRQRFEARWSRLFRYATTWWFVCTRMISSLDRWLDATVRTTSDMIGALWRWGWNRMFCSVGCDIVDRKEDVVVQDQATRSTVTDLGLDGKWVGGWCAPRNGAAMMEFG